MIPLQITLIAVAAALAIGFSGGWKVNGWRYDADRTAQMEGATKALELTAKELAKIDVKNTTIRQEVQTRVIEKPIYHECKHDADTFRLLNSALTAGKQSTGGSKLSGTDTAK